MQTDKLLEALKTRAAQRLIKNKLINTNLESLDHHMSNKAGRPRGYFSTSKPQTKTIRLPMKQLNKLAKTSTNSA